MRDHQDIFRKVKTMTKKLPIMLLALVLLGVLVANLSPFAALRSDPGPKAQVAIAPASEAMTRLDTANTVAYSAIVPAPVIDPNPSFFVGTGDGGNGVWTRQ
jgi:hypothetical protein